MWSGVARGVWLVLVSRGLAFTSQAVGTSWSRDSGRMTSSNVFPSHFLKEWWCLSERLGMTSLSKGRGSRGPRPSQAQPGLS